MTAPGNTVSLQGSREEPVAISSVLERWQETCLGSRRVGLFGSPNIDRVRAR
jgi:hypothetical protein